MYFFSVTCENVTMAIFNATNRTGHVKNVRKLVNCQNTPKRGLTFRAEVSLRQTET